MLIGEAAHSTSVFDNVMIKAHRKLDWVQDRPRIDLSQWVCEEVSREI